MLKKIINLTKLGFIGAELVIHFIEKGQSSRPFLLILV